MLTKLRIYVKLLYRVFVSHFGAFLVTEGRTGWLNNPLSDHGNSHAAHLPTAFNYYLVLEIYINYFPVLIDLDVITNIINCFG